MAAPTGRAANPTNWVPNDESVPARVDSPGKNTCGKTSAAAVPYRKKSYHSIVVPIVLATAALVRCDFVTEAGDGRPWVSLAIAALHFDDDVALVTFPLATFVKRGTPADNRR